jgi:hypothetical protein
MTTKSPDVVSKIKAWLFPTVVTVLTSMILKDLSELKNDVKQLLAQSNIDKTKIESLEKQIDMLNQKMMLSSNETVGTHPFIPPVPKDNKDASLSSRVYINDDKKKKPVSYTKKRPNVQA